MRVWWLRALLAVGCTWGTFNPPPLDPAVQPWVGGWSVSGTGDWGGPAAIGGTTNVIQGAQANTITFAVSGCNLTWNVNGNSGAPANNQTCVNFQVGNGPSVQSAKWSSGSAVLDPSATPHTMTVQLMGTACCASSTTITMAATLTRMGP